MRPAWSPDSTHLAFTQLPQGSGVADDQLVLVQAGSWEALALGNLSGGYYPMEWR